MAGAVQTYTTCLFEELMNEQRIISAGNDVLCSSQSRPPSPQPQFSVARAVSGAPDLHAHPLFLLSAWMFSTTSSTWFLNSKYYKRLRRMGGEDFSNKMAIFRPYSTALCTISNFKSHTLPIRWTLVIPALLPIRK